MKNKSGVVAMELLRYLLALSIIAMAFGYMFTACAVSDSDPSYIECSAKAKRMGFEFDWGPIQGCMIKVKGQWIDINKYRIAE